MSLDVMGSSAPSVFGHYMEGICSLDEAVDYIISEYRDSLVSLSSDVAVSRITITLFSYRFMRQLFPNCDKTVAFLDAIIPLFESMRSDFC